MSNEPWSYVVKMQNGALLRRNRRFLRKLSGAGAILHSPTPMTLSAGTDRPNQEQGDIPAVPQACAGGGSVNPESTKNRTSGAELAVKSTTNKNCDKTRETNWDNVKFSRAISYFN